MIEQVITSSILILAICLIRLLFEQKISACQKYALWLLVAVKLLIPIPDFENQFSVMNVVERLEPAGVQYRFVDTQAESEGTGADRLSPDRRDDGSAFMSDGAAEGHGAGSVDKMTNVLFVIWLVGAAAAALLFAVANFRFLRALRRDRRSQGTYRRLPVYDTDRVVSPCLYGVIRPAIYLPRGAALEKAQQWYILSHEYVHYKHGDHLWALARSVCTILYWYHPLVWLAAVLSVRDGELACDESTIRLIGEENRIAYGETLLAILQEMCGKQNKAEAFICSTSMSGGMRDMGRRMKRIARRRRINLAAVLLVFAFSAGLIGCTFGSAVIGGHESEDGSAHEAGAAAQAEGVAGRGKALGNEMSADGDSRDEEAKREAMLAAERAREVAEAAEREAVEAMLAAERAREAAETAEREAVDMESVERAREAAEAAEAAEREAVEAAERAREAADVAERKTKDGQSAGETSADSLMQDEVVLYAEPKADLVCVRVEPSVLRDRLCYFYIPEVEEQDRLLELVKEMTENAGKRKDISYPEMRETGWALFYKDQVYQGFENGIFRWTEVDKQGELSEYIVKNQALYELVSQMMERIAYQPVDITRIQKLTAAKLKLKGFRAAGKTETRTITDRQTLDELATWLGEAEYIKGGADCCNEDACLELTLADGEKLCLSLATDDCPNFGANGVYYDYRPKAYRGKGGWYSDELFRLFDESFVDHEADTATRDVR